ncbi:uncharacterized protein PAC_02357 [Phialocephala subalpina]|uniref:Uncharacterized protein n=1 Tax=Phialocephala subalpina TaxID=576137 RepID=A0A1L7WI89_9HELO|nr:uncharacterized protein PAC_02357 [Phialocephala subalpina]
MSGFASLEPALTARLTFDAPFPIGSLGSGISLQVAPINGGTVRSEPGFSGPEVDAEFIFGSDHVHIDPPMKNVRINVKAVLKNKDGSLIHYSYTGIIEMTPEGVAILMGSPDAKTTPFGSIFTHVDFETGAENLKSLETSKFVGCSRFVVEEGKPVVVESKISKVVYK